MICSVIYAGTVTVESISIVSNARTRDFIIIQELEIQKGMSYSSGEFEDKISNSIQNLKNLGLFSDVRIVYETVTNAPGLKEGGNGAVVEVIAVDKWTFFPVPFYYYDNKIGNSVMVEIIEGNLAGLNQSLEIDYNYESIPDLQDISLEYGYPRIFGSYFGLDFSFAFFEYIDTAYNGDELVYKSLHSEYSNYIRVDRKFPVKDSQWTFFADTALLYITDNIEINDAGMHADNGVILYPGIGLEEGIVNYDLGAIWGHFYRVKLAVSPLSGGFQSELKANQYFRFWDKSGIAVRAVFRSSSLDELLLTPDDIRGISLGQIRGNYLLFGNFEFRPYICTLTWPVILDFYTPLFVDMGEGMLSNQDLSMGSSAITAGLGLRFYPRDFGGSQSVIRFDFGAVLPSLFAGEPFEKYFYFAFNLQDEFD